jgi:hypothetical protein
VTLSIVLLDDEDEGSGKPLVKPVVETARARKDPLLAITNPGLLGAKKVEALPPSPVSSPFSTASLMKQAEERTKGDPVKQEKPPILYNWRLK